MDHPPPLYGTWEKLTIGNILRRHDPLQNIGNKFKMGNVGTKSTTICKFSLQGRLSFLGSNQVAHSTSHSTKKNTAQSTQHKEYSTHQSARSTQQESHILQHAAHSKQQTARSRQHTAHCKYYFIFLSGTLEPCASRPSMKDNKENPSNVHGYV